MTVRDAPVEDLDAAMQAVSDRVLADADGAGPPLRLRVDPTFSSPDGRQRDVRPVAAHIVGAVGKHEFAGGFDAGLEAGCAHVMSVYQDEVVAMRGRPWPEISDRAGVLLGVLDVAVTPVGVAHWHLRGEPLCAVGHLVASCRARGWHVS